MRKMFGILGALALLTSTAAMAADMPVKAPPLNPIYSGYPYGSSGLFYGAYAEGGGGPVNGSAVNTVTGVSTAGLVELSAGFGLTVGYCVGHSHKQRRLFGRRRHRHDQLQRINARIQCRRPARRRGPICRIHPAREPDAVSAELSELRHAATVQRSARWRDRKSHANRSHGRDALERYLAGFPGVVVQQGIPRGADDWPRADGATEQRPRLADLRQDDIPESRRSRLARSRPRRLTAASANRLSRARACCSDPCTAKRRRRNLKTLCGVLIPNQR